MTRRVAQVGRSVGHLWRRSQPRLLSALPVILDTAGFVALTIGVAVLAGAGWAWITAGGLLIIVALRVET